MEESSDLLSFNPDRRDFEPYGLTCARWRPSRMQRPDHHNEIELNFLQSGTVTYLLGGRKVTLVTGQLSAFWAAIPHQIIDYSDEPSYFVATIPLPWFLQWNLPKAFAQSLLAGELIAEPSGHRAAMDAQLFAQWVHDLTSSSKRRTASVVLEIQARLLRLAKTRPNTSASTPRKRSQGLNKAELMACFVAQNYLKKLTVQQIAAVAQLHPNYAMNLFQKTLGTTLVDYITKHRVAHAQRLLATTDAKITSVANDSGFHSISRFNIAFRQVCNCSPREYRRSHRGTHDAAG